MPKRLLLPALLALAACTKAPPASRPADVCATVKADVDCAQPPDGEAAGKVTPAENCFWVANQQYHCGLFDESAKSYEKSAALHADAKTFHALGEAYFVQEKFQQAYAAYRKAVDLDPKKRESWLRLGQIALRQKQFDDAHGFLAKAITLDATRPDAFRADADALAGQQKYVEAVDALRKAEALGDAKNKAEATEQEVEIRRYALRKLQKAQAADDALAAASDGLAEALDRLVTLVPDDPRLLRDLADARLASGDLEAAEKALQKASEHDPKDFISPRVVGLLREKRNDPRGAREALQASLHVQAKQAMSWIILGRLDSASGDAEAAEKDFAQALANEDAKDADETRQLAELAFVLGHKDKAEQLYQLLDDDPDLSARKDFWLDRARISASLGHKAQVELACKRARALVETVECPPKPVAPAK